jgi:hypothetical protein
VGHSIGAIAKAIGRPKSTVSQASRRPRQSASKRRGVVAGVLLCAAAPLEPPYAPAAVQNHRALS